VKFYVIIARDDRTTNESFLQRLLKVITGTRDVALCVLRRCRLISTFLASLELKAFDVKALRAFRVLRPLKLVSGVPSE